MSCVDDGSIKLFWKQWDTKCYISHEHEKSKCPKNPNESVMQKWTNDVNDNGT